ncbi:hypothetical protein [Saccharopolyspora hordei]|uniref:Uncharacterized protein n=1 Tax=Saccharopolyspora hordei TaxID=1838 RepID=A0A853AEQ2_9PSEU|nr:hypothetical protein [Saccharopolyspora hordei]NYI82428.1 hypothetical protein [Saccharopolyspora hordei]
MFETPVGVHPMLGRVLGEPRPVWVDLAALLPRDGSESRRGRHRPLIVRAQGLALDREVEGQLHAWVRASNGLWLGLVTFALHSRALGDLPVRQLAPPAALRPRPSDTDRAPQRDAP